MPEKVVISSLIPSGKASAGLLGNAGRVTGNIGGNVITGIADTPEGKMALVATKK